MYVHLCLTLTEQATTLDVTADTWTSVSVLFARGRQEFHTISVNYSYVQLALPLELPWKPRFVPSSPLKVVSGLVLLSHISKHCAEEPPAYWDGMG